LFSYSLLKNGRLSLTIRIGFEVLEPFLCYYCLLIKKVVEKRKLKAKSQPPIAERKNYMKQKIAEWLKRYGLAEVISLSLTVLCAWLAFHFTQNKITTALVGTWGGNIGYFGTILIEDILLATKQLRAVGKQYSLETFYKNVRALFVEFGIAEIFDTLFIRPTLMYYIPIWIGDLSWGVVVAKFAADITFYIPAIISYELSKKKLRDFE
jgi:hypothetical protein